MTDPWRHLRTVGDVLCVVWGALRRASLHVESRSTVLAETPYFLSCIVAANSVGM